MRHLCVLAILTLVFHAWRELVNHSRDILHFFGKVFGWINYVGDIWPGETPSFHSLSIIFLQEYYSFWFGLHLLLLQSLKYYFRLWVISLVIFLINLRWNQMLNFVSPANWLASSLSLLSQVHYNIFWRLLMMLIVSNVNIRFWVVHEVLRVVVVCCSTRIFNWCLLEVLAHLIKSQVRDIAIS